jgi:hypothetical protein
LPERHTDVCCCLAAHHGGVDALACWQHTAAVARDTLFI